jgi:thiamine biosynthesis lipoprotein
MIHLQQERKAMGSHFELQLFSAGAAQGGKAMEAAWQQIDLLEDLLSEFRAQSDTSRLNQQAGKNWTPVSETTFQLIRRCLDLSKLTKGYFDITVRPLKKLYDFRKAQQISFPSPEQIQEAIQKTGYQKIQLHLEKPMVRFAHPDLEISFAAIGKGTASDLICRLWKSEGFPAGCVNAGGDLHAWGNRPDGEPWRVGIRNPMPEAPNMAWIPLKNAAVATSGDYEQHFVYQGKRYSHNINPHTGLPITGIQSVSVISPSAELSDAMATALYAMGLPEGLHFINHLPQTHALVLDVHNRLHASAGLQGQGFENRSHKP